MSLINFIFSQSSQQEGKFWMHSYYQDGMIFQQGLPIVFEGRGVNGKQVEVTFLNEKKRAEVAQGKWKVEFPPQKASHEPLSITISHDNSIKNIRDALIGELWILAGQSNMGWTVSQSTDATLDLLDKKFPSIRYFTFEPGSADSPQEDVFRGIWLKAEEKQTAFWSAVGLYFANHLQSKVDVPIGLIQTSMGGTIIQSWIPKEILMQTPELKNSLDQHQKALEIYPVAHEKYQSDLLEFEKKVADAKVQGQRPPVKDMYLLYGPMGPQHPMRPSALYYYRVSPFQRIPVKGVLWYQGEGNANPYYFRFYEDALTRMIGAWRRDWNRPDLPFVIVQLPGYQKDVNFNWPSVRQSQENVSKKVPGVGLVVAIDEGEADNIHPLNKKTIGHRLADYVGATQYGVSGFYQGPFYDSSEVKGNQMIVRFKVNGTQIISKKEPILGFELADATGEFYPAQATLSGNELVVETFKVKVPARVRYLWKNYPKEEVSLYNQEGYPLAPFTNF